MALTDARRQVANLMTAATKEIREITQFGGADDPATKRAAGVLARNMRRLLNVKALVTRRTFGGEQQRNEGSQPGEPPRRRSGKLARSVGQEVVGGVRRVGPARFVGRLLEEGVDSTANVTQSGRLVGSLRKSRKSGAIGRQRRRKGGVANRIIRIARRPFMDKALAAALPNMEGEAVSELQSRSRKRGL